MAKKKKYVKLGPKALSFADPFTRFNISGKQVKELETLEQRRSGKIRRAIAGGHLVVVDESEYLKAQKGLDETVDEETSEPTLRETLEAKTKKELVAYYETNYEVADEEVDAFSKLNKDDMVEELVELAEEDEE